MFLLLSTLTIITAIILPKRYTAIIAIVGMTLSLISSIISVYHMTSFGMLIVYEYERFQGYSILTQIFYVLAIATSLYAMVVKATKSEIIWGLAYIFSAILLIGSSHMITLIVLWELLCISSIFLLAKTDINGGFEATFRYAIWHFFGGILLLAGIIGYIVQTGDITIEVLSFEHWSTYLIFFGVILNCGLFPFNFWAIDAYPKTNAYGGVVLTSVTTKASIIVLARLFTGADILSIFALLTLIYSAIAVFHSNNIKRSLTHALLMQMAIMALFIASGAENSTQIVSFYAANHIAYKSIFFMIAGLLYSLMNVRYFDEIGSMQKSWPIVSFITIFVSAIAVGFPFTSGFFSKELLLNTLGYNNDIYWLIVLVFSGVAILPTAIWFYKWIFLTSNNYRAAEPLPKVIYLALLPMVLVSFIPLVLFFIDDNFAELFNKKFFISNIHALQFSFMTVGAGLILAKLFNPSYLKLARISINLRNQYLINTYNHVSEFFKSKYGKVIDALENKTEYITFDFIPMQKQMGLIVTLLTIALCILLLFV